MSLGFVSDYTSEEKEISVQQSKSILIAKRPAIFLRSWFIVADFYPISVGKQLSKK